MSRQVKIGGVQYRAAPSVEIIDGAERVVKFIASNEEVDRYGDIIRAKGWQLDNFRKNPMLLFGHNSADYPIGRVRSIKVEGTQLVADAEFMTADLSEQADTVYRMVKAGFLNAVSVGFRPIERPKKIMHPETNEWTGGFEFLKQELFELSVVPVPALPGALAVSRSLAGAGSVEDYFRSLDGEDTGRLAAIHAHALRTVDILKRREAA